TGPALSPGRGAPPRSGGHPLPESLHPVDEGARLRRMPASVVADEGRFQLVQQLALLVGQVHRRLDHHLAVKVAGGAAAYRLHALVAQAEDLAGLGFGGDADLGLAAEGGHAGDVAQRGLGDADRHLAVQVVAVALEDRVLANADFDIEIAGLGSRRAGLALAGQADAIAVVDARGHLHRQHLFLFHAAVAPAGGARRPERLAPALAGRARLLHREDAALEPHL